jgi:hypothetical protein
VSGTDDQQHPVHAVFGDPIEVGEDAQVALVLNPDLVSLRVDAEASRGNSGRQYTA